MFHIKALFNITICGNNEALRTDFIAAIKEGYLIASSQRHNAFVVYNCNNKKDKLSLLNPFKKNKNIIVNNFDKLSITEIKKIINRNGFATIFTSELSNEEICKLFSSSGHAELYMLLAPYLVDVTDFDKTVSRFEIVTKSIFYIFEKCNKST